MRRPATESMVGVVGGIVTGMPVLRPEVLAVGIFATGLVAGLPRGRREGLTPALAGTVVSWIILLGVHALAGTTTLWSTASADEAARWTLGIVIGVVLTVLLAIEVVGFAVGGIVRAVARRIARL
jgi:hypothetical protein